MINVSDNFKEAMKQPVKEIQAFINYEDQSISDSDDLISFKISCDSGLCKTAMRKLEAKFLGSHNVLGKWVNVSFGVRLPDGSFEYLNYGSFLVTELTETKDTETISIVGYDKMINAMTPYVKLNVEYPLKLTEYTRILCEACGLEISNNAFGKNLFDQSFHPTITKNGLTYQYLPEEDCILINGTKTVTDGYYLELPFPISCNVGDNYTLSSYYVDGTVTIPSGYAVAYWGSLNTATGYLDNWSDVMLLTVDDRTTSVMTKNEITHFWFYVSAGVKFENYKVKLQFEKGNIPTSVYKKYNPMNDWQITQELWENIEGITYRDIFQQIAQATASTCIMHDNKVYFKPLTDTGEKLTYDNMFKLKLEALYGEINSVVLSRTPSEDNVYLQNELSVQENGLTEFKIENNEIIDKDRKNAITPIFDVLNGVCYYPFETTTEGLGWYEIGDNLTIVNDTGVEFKTTLFNYSITVDGSIKETLKTTAESKTQTQYQYATTISKQLQKNAEIIVNKQEQYIKSIVEEKENGINKRLSTIEQNIENINFNVQNSGGSNLIKNSVMFAYDKNDNPNNWEVVGDGTLSRVSDVSFQNSGGLSCHGFMLSNKTVRTEQIPVKPFDENNPIFYSFSTKIKKDSKGSCYVKIYNPDVNEEHIISLAEGVTSKLEDHELTALKPLGEYYIIEFYGSADSNVIFTDNMFAIGEHKTQWTQANGEIMNTQVNISLDGIVVRSDTVLGDYTVISKYEFAGWSNINGTMTKIFTLNKGVTEVKELLAKDSISMPPLKIVPITEGDMQGWAFVIT